jgi:hypothetical protein
MKQCSRCFEVLEDSAFSPRQRQCLPCRAEYRKHRQLENQCKKVPIPNHLAPAVNYIQKLIKNYDRSKPLEIPTKAILNPMPAPGACMLVPGLSRAMYRIASNRGQRTVLLETCGPLDLIRNLREMGLDILVPTDKVARYDRDKA